MSECEFTIVAELVLEDGTALYPSPSGHMVTSECGVCPSFESITPIVKENCNGCLELDLGDGTETFTYGTLFGQEDMCDNSDMVGKKVKVKVRNEPGVPAMCHMYQTCAWSNTKDGVVNHNQEGIASRVYIFTDNFAGNIWVPVANVENDYKYMLFTVTKENLTVDGVLYPTITSTICYEYMGTFLQIPYEKDPGYRTAYYRDVDLSWLTEEHLTFQAENCCGATG